MRALIMLAFLFYCYLAHAVLYRLQIVIVSAEIHIQIIGNLREPPAQ